MNIPSANNDTLQDILESAITGRADENYDDHSDEGFDHAGTWGPVGGVGGFLLLLASAVAVAHKYWGALRHCLIHSLIFWTLRPPLSAGGRIRLPPSPPLRSLWKISLTMIGLGRTLEGSLIVLGTII